jgi:hypothetical protein
VHINERWRSTLGLRYTDGEKNAHHRLAGALYFLTPD